MTKNTDFRFDQEITNTMLISLVMNRLISLVRGMKLSFITKRFKWVFMGKSVSIFNKNGLRIGNNVTIGDYVKLSALGTGGLSIDDNVNIGSFSHIIVSTSFNNIGEFIRLGKNVAVGEFSYLGGGGGLEIGKDTIIGQYFSAHPENHVFSDTNKLIRSQGVDRQGIKIGDNCWIGAKVTVLDGVNIGSNSVVAAGSVVTESFGEGVLIAGVPAKIIRQFKHHE
jgi:acetyltransferase-like isoleucine patch superfamily enzyme